MGDHATLNVCLVESHINNGPANAEEAYLYFSPLFGSKFNSEGTAFIQPKKQNSSSHLYDGFLLQKKRESVTRFSIYIYGHFQKPDYSGVKHQPLFRLSMFLGPKLKYQLEECAGLANDPNNCNKWVSRNIQPRMSSHPTNSDYKLMEDLYPYAKLFGLQVFLGEKHSCQTAHYSAASVNIQHSASAVEAEIE